MTQLALPYPVRWLTCSAQGLAFGAGLVAFAGITSLAGALSATSWLNASMVLVVVAMGFGGALGPFHALTRKMNFIEKNLFTCCCGLLIVGAYALAFGQLHRLRMLLSESAEKQELLLRITPATEPAMLQGAAWLAGGALVVGIGMMLFAGLRRRKAMEDKGAVVCLMFSTSVLTFMAGRSAWFLIQAVA